MNWKFSKTVKEGEPYLIQNVNIWGKQWKKTGEKINVKDPLYNQNYIFNVYEINEEGKNIKFSAGEFSNNIWGIYEFENISIKNIKSLSRKLFVIGLILIFSSLLMLILGVGMFVSRGDYSRFIIKLSEFCFVFWVPFLISGILLTFTSLIIKLVRSLKLDSE